MKRKMNRKQRLIEKMARPRARVVLEKVQSCLFEKKKVPKKQFFKEQKAVIKKLEQRRLTFIRNRII